jgi:hypothetical protein
VFVAAMALRDRDGWKVGLPVSAARTASSRITQVLDGPIGRGAEACLAATPHHAARADGRGVA